MDNRGRLDEKIVGFPGNGGEQNIWQSDSESANGNLSANGVDSLREAEQAADMRNLGGQVLAGEFGQNKTELENVVVEVEWPDDYVGGKDSEILREEWERDDREDEENVNGQGEIGFVEKIVVSGIRGEAEKAMETAENFLKEKDPSPAKLVEQRTAGSNKVFSFVGREVGGRNNAA